MQGTPVASYLRQWGVVAGSGAWREGIDKMEIILIFNLAVKSAFHRNPKIFTGKNFAKKKNRFSFISMPVWAVTKTKNFMKKIRFIIVASSIAVFATFAAVTEASALRVLDYTWNCVGCGGDCLDDVIVKSRFQ